MITKHDALTEDRFHSNTGTTRDGRCQVWRRNGATQTWKTRPTHFRIPVKYGMYSYEQIWHTDAHAVHLERDCPRRQGRDD